MYKCLCLSEDAEVYVTIEGVKLKFVEKEDMKLLSLSLSLLPQEKWMESHLFQVSALTLSCMWKSPASSRNPTHDLKNDDHKRPRSLLLLTPHDDLNPMI